MINSISHTRMPNGRGKNESHIARMTVKTNPTTRTTMDMKCCFALFDFMVGILFGQEVGDVPTSLIFKTDVIGQISDVSLRE